MIVVFRGCMWDGHWEFDAPGVLYQGARRYRIGGNSGILIQAIEDAISDHFEPGRPKLSDPWSPSDLHEFKWRGWSTSGFRRRRNAWHIEQVWELESEDACRLISEREQRGPFGRHEGTERGRRRNDDR